LKSCASRASTNPRTSVEKWEQNLKKNMSTVDKDKGKLVSTIEELDRYKRDALMKTWKSVNE
jgi:structural maintenance of chromosome 2